jgi:hypothetical protein
VAIGDAVAGGRRVGVDVGEGVDVAVGGGVELGVGEGVDVGVSVGVGLGVSVGNGVSVGTSVAVGAEAVSVIAVSRVPWVTVAAASPPISHSQPSAQAIQPR